MSIDFNFICTGCKKYKHAGQMMGGRFSFGYGSNDHEGKKNVENFVHDHMWCGEENGVGCGVVQTVQLISADSTPDEYEDIEGD